MTPERYRQLERNGRGLTDAEKSEGWHFCPDWDGMLIGPGMGMEINHCDCLRPRCEGCEE